MCEGRSVGNGIGASLGTEHPVVSSHPEEGRREGPLMIEARRADGISGAQPPVNAEQQQPRGGDGI